MGKKRLEGKTALITGAAQGEPYAAHEEGRKPEAFKTD